MFNLRNIVIISYYLVTVFSEKYETVDFSLSNHLSEIRSKRAAKTSTAKNECVSTVCKSATSEMLVAMNHHAEPCEEFHELTCGNKKQLNGLTTENFKVLENYMNKNITFKSEKFLQDFKSFYGSCTHYSTEFNFLKGLDFVKNLSATDITETFVESIISQSMPFFDVGIDIGAEDGTYQFLLTLPGESPLKTHTSGWSILEESQNECLEVAQNFVHTKTVDLDQMYGIYRKCKQQTLFKYAENFERILNQTNKLTNNEAYLKELLEFYELNLVSEEVIRVTQNSKKFTTMTMNEIKDKYGVIDWKLFFEKLTTNKTFTGDEKVLVAFPSYFQTIFEALSKYDTGKLRRMFEELTSLHFYRNLLITKNSADKMKLYCMDMAYQLMPDIVSWILYDLSPVKKIFLAVHQTNKLFADLKTQLKKSFEGSSLDDMSKEKFVKKLERLNLGLITTGDTNTTRDNYKFVKVKDDYQQNLVMLLENYRKCLYNFVGSKSSPATLLNFFIGGFHTKFTTYYTSDSIVLHPELFKKVPAGLPEHIRLAKLGFSLAQSMAKHFDPTGRLYMTDDIRSNDVYYEDLVTHMTEIFDKYYTKNPYSFHKSILKFKPVNGKQFVNEMIADNAAFRLITNYFSELKKLKDLPWITSESISLNQSLFIASAQVFCDDQSESTFMRDLLEKRQLPFGVKMRNIISNSQFFSQSFKCLEGSSLWLDPSVIRQFPQAPDEYDDQGQLDGQYEDK